MLVTVAICTWNRSAMLCQALEHMTRLAIPAGVDWELLVVNNNSTDATDDVIASFTARLPIRRIFEAQPGVSSARNAAVREARGEYILWTDDDGLVDQNWVAAYVKAFSRWPEAAFFGGPVRPWFATPPPFWLKRAWPQVAHTYAARDFGAHPVPLDGTNRLPFGVNWVVRRKEQLSNLFNPRLGPQPGSHMRGDETPVIRALLASGCTGWWVPDAVVQHYIPPERINLTYIRNYFSGYGEYLALSEAPWTGSTWFGKPRWLWRRAITAELSYRLHRVTAQPEVWIPDLIAASTAWGSLLAAKQSTDIPGSCL